MKHQQGEYSEGMKWEVRKNKREHYAHKTAVCKHALNIKPTNNDSKTVSCTVPRVIVAWCEGGYNCTHLCLDCVLESYGK